MGAPDTAPDPSPVAGGGRLRRSAAVAVALLVAVALAVVIARRDPAVVSASVRPADPVAGSEVRGGWDTTTTTAPPPTTSLPAADDGLAIAPPLERPWPDSFLVADAAVPQVPLFQSPGVPVPSGRAMDDPSWEGLDLVFLVRERSADWLRVQLMSRPNSAMAWIRRADVTLRRVPHHIVIERGARRLTVYRGETAVFQADVATGKASSPTPLGTFFVDGITRLRPPHPAYGNGQVSFTGFSEVYQSFGGGVGQVAMHGTQNPALIGTPASNGCVRLRNEDIDAVTGLSPTGTPVEVVA